MDVGKPLLVMLAACACTGPERDRGLTGLPPPSDDSGGTTGGPGNTSGTPDPSTSGNDPSTTAPDPSTSGSGPGTGGASTTGSPTTGDPSSSSAGSDGASSTGGDGGTTTGTSNPGDPAGMPGECGTGDYLVRYRPMGSAGEIKPEIEVVNQGTQTPALDDVNLRYWFTLDDVPGLTVNVTVAAANHDGEPYYTDYGPASLQTQVIPVSPPVEAADHSVWMGFAPGTGVFSPGDRLSIQFFTGQSDHSVVLDQTNDYSYGPGITELVDWDRITLEVEGELAWGCVPDGTDGGSTGTTGSGTEGGSGAGSTGDGGGTGASGTGTTGTGSTGLGTGSGTGTGG